MQLKHLFVFLLVFLVSIADVNLYVEENTTSYYLSSKVIKTKNISSKRTKYIVFNKILYFNYFLAYLFQKNNIKKGFQEQIFLILKLQKQLYQKIALQNIQYTFLTTKITSSNSVSSLYFA